ncbi:ComEC/Rec2 family competence protein [Aeromonas veronii]
MNGLQVHFIDAGVGDCILITDLVNNKKILIDSGPSKGEGRLSVSKNLSQLLCNDKKIDIAIVTHNDDDHIGGFKSLIEEEIIKVDKFIFNNIQQIENDIIESKKASYRQDMELHSLANRMGINIDIIIVEDDTPNIMNIGNMALKFISPNKNKIEQLIRWSQSESAKINERQKLSPVQNSECLEDVIIKIKDDDCFTPDKSPTNGSSIAFILEYGEYKFLFLGDAHMDIVEDFFSRGGEKINFELIKLSHHSSEKNNSKTFFDQISCDKFIFCCDGLNSHGHPSLVTIARLSINFPNSKLFFTSDNEHIKHITKTFSSRCTYSTDGLLEFNYEL